MDFADLKKNIQKLYGPALALEASMSRRTRRHLEMIFGIVALSGLGASLMLHLSGILGGFDATLIAHKTFGATCMSAILWATFFLLECFYNSYYYREVGEKDFYASFDLANAIRAVKKDITGGFFTTHLGKLVLLRCGISLSAFGDFLASRKSVVSPESVSFRLPGNELSLSAFLLSLVRADKPLAEFLFAFSIQEKELSGIADWIEELSFASSRAERWWGEENLSRVQGVGQDWSYGQVYNLKKYEKPLISGLSRHYRVHSSYGVKELAELESVLSRTRDANALLVGDDEAGRLQIAAHLSQAISEGASLARLRHKRVILLDNDALVSANGSKAAFESEFMGIMAEAVRAGNIVLVIDNLPGLISAAAAFGADFPALLENFLSSQGLQVIALSNTDRFHAVLEKNQIFMQHFENILIREIDDSNALKVLENELVRFEREGLFFTYPALLAVVDGAERYFPDGVMPDKAIDLLLEIVPKLLSERKSLVEKGDVLGLIETKTGIPVGEVKAEEREKLLDLENILKARIVGQDEAVKTVSSAVRRARSGITNPDRPLGSFLFLGPTGVGKTETTKVLADVFFGESARILRLDMSEYSGADSVEKLIGSFGSGKEGVLSSLLRERQYGVLLLDEFEKTTPDVMNLFLQILDEGFFSDSSGRKVSARNLIIIATSNAGSDRIWSAMQAGKDLSREKDAIVDDIVKSGVFKPELLNRFDGVVLFHPLTPAHLKRIAGLMLQKLHDRLAMQGINLAIDENLIDYVVGFGTDPKFGARPMNRAIQDKVEEAVARKILADSIPKGQEIRLNQGDFS
jgi:ATP-dependent Clp protease ATP-binding subunit ClpC